MLILFEPEDSLEREKHDYILFMAYRYVILTDKHGIYLSIQYKTKI